MNTTESKENSMTEESYCGDCGRTRRNDGKRRLPYWPVVLLFVLGTMLSGLVFLQNFQLKKQVDVLAKQQSLLFKVLAKNPSQAPATDDALTILGYALRNPCGEGPLAVGNCDKALGMKAEIANLIAENKAKPEIFAYFIDKYGKDALSDKARAILASRGK